MKMKRGASGQVLFCIPVYFGAKDQSLYESVVDACEKANVPMSALIKDLIALHQKDLNDLADTRRQRLNQI